MMLVANSCLAQIIFAGDILAMIIVTLQNDLQQRHYQDSLCVFRGYLSYVLSAVTNYSFLLQAIYRYVIVIYPSRLVWQSVRIQVIYICMTWIFGFIYPLAFMFTGNIIYNFDNQICQIPLRPSFSLVFMICNAYVIPVLVIQFIYLKLVRYVKEMSKRVATGNSLSRGQRELKMVRRIVIIVTILTTLCLPYTVFICMSFFTDPPIYHFRIASAFINSSLLLIMIALFQFTDPLRASILKRIHLRPAVIVPCMA
jgi:hypothetical protein